MGNAISEFLQVRIDEGDFPSAVYLVAEKGEIILQDALGLAVVEPEKIKAQIDTIYDLASLTKPLVTGLLCAKLLENGYFNLNSKFSNYGDDFTNFGEEKFDITLKQALTHTTGFPAWRPFYLLKEKVFGKIPDYVEIEIWEIVQNLILREEFEYKPESKVVYSDLNFLILGILLECFYGVEWGFNANLSDIAKREIFEPLNLKDTFFNPPQELQKRIAANEFGNEFEKQMCIEKGYEIPNSKSQIRNRIIWGEVHDGNCYFMNGISGHAGLFSTAAEIFKIAQQFLAEETVLLKSETCKLFHTNFTKDLNEARSIAFQLAETPESTASNALSKDSFGHLGFTGTSVWIEPETERIFILLTNRTHNRKPPFVIINSVRRRFHELATELLNKRKM